MAWTSNVLFSVIFLCMSMTTVYPQHQDGDQDGAPTTREQKLQHLIDIFQNIKSKNLSTDSSDTESVFTALLSSPWIRTQILQKGIGDFYSKEGKSFLFIAAEEGSLPLVKVVMQLEPNIDLTDENGWTALLVAASKNHTDVSIFFINSGADVNVHNTDFGDTTLMWAAHWGNLEIARTLIQAGAEVNARDFDGDTPLDIAASKGHLGVVNELLWIGANVDSQDNDGFTALISAVQENHLEVVKALLRANADPNLKTDRGETALYWAMNNNYNDILRELIVFGADINLPNNQGLTPLGLAAKLNRPEDIRLLLSAGAEIDKQASDGDTALMEAVNFNFVEVTKAILEHCPNLNIVNRNGKDVHFIATSRQNRQILTMIRDHPRLRCTHENVAYLSGDSRYDVCREVKCCQGIWSPTGRTLETCGEQCKKILAPAGVCTAVDNCPRLAEEVRSFLSLPDGFQRGIDLIQSYGCSFFQGNTHICCPTA